MYIYRNYTIELLFNKFKPIYSGYGDISTSVEDSNSERIVFFYNLNPCSSSKEIIEQLEDIYDRINILFNINNLTKSVLIILPDVNFYDKLILSSKDIDDAYRKLFLSVYDLCSKNSLIKFVEFKDFTKIVGQENLIDWKYYYTSQIVLNPKLSSIFTEWFSAVLDSLAYKRKKCLILDCDNTLWGGVVGEDGLSGIQIGNSFPGNIYQDFQKKIIQLYENGVIIALCSKNNFKDVENVFMNHSGMVLQLKHISCQRINWQNKAKNIQEIAEELNIGLDAIVFIDDNPSERELVRSFLKSVVIPDFPSYDYLIPDFFSKVCNKYFKTYKLTREDLAKSEQYLENSKRNELKLKFDNLEDYINSLEIEINLQILDDSNIARLAQMSQKTNQFNLTTKRYSESDLKNLKENGAYVICAYVKDKFGDNGITILSIFNISGTEAECDSYLLSCRILGKGIERATFFFILNYLYAKGIRKVIARFIPTEKNIQVENFFEGLGFECIEKSKNGIKKYNLQLSETIQIGNNYKINFI